MAANRSYGGIPAAQRSRARRAQLVEATLDIVGSRGYGALTVSGLCRETGLNDRYFYEHFANRNAVFMAVVEQIAEETMSAIVAEVSTAGDDEVIRVGLRAAIEFLTNDPRRARVVFVEAPVHDPDHRRRGIRDLFVTLMHAQAQLRFGDLTDRLDTRIKFAGTHMFGALIETTTSWLDGELALTRDELVEYSADMLAAIMRHVLSQADISRDSSK